MMKSTREEDKRTTLDTKYNMHGLQYHSLMLLVEKNDRAHSLYTDVVK